MLVSEYMLMNMPFILNLCLHRVERHCIIFTHSSPFVLHYTPHSYFTGKKLLISKSFFMYYTHLFCKYFLVWHFVVSFL